MEFLFIIIKSHHTLNKKNKNMFEPIILQESLKNIFKFTKNFHFFSSSF